MPPPQTELPSEVASVDAARAWAEQIADACEFGEEDRYRIGLAVHEAAANAIVHGNRQRPGTAVRLRWQLTDGRLTVTVGDDGPGFTPPAPPAPDAAPGLGTSGRGLGLIARLTDDFHVSHREDPPGTDLVLVIIPTEGNGAPVQAD
ncbi:ATP-binding protein [Kitasatospora sp. NBC_00458]|uniref:ATP-binding protein n=1 Tax=Kitasatospora sp. NBC_00458 TaxID=2903568 RepID=UPI002E1827E7